MAEQRKLIVPPKIPPPPPPRSRTPKNNEAGSLIESISPPSKPEAATATKESPTSPPVRQQKIRRPAPTPPDLSEAAILLSTSPPAKTPRPQQRPPVQPFGPRHPPVSMNPAGRDSPSVKSPSSADRTPKKGFLQSVYSRTRDIFSRRKTTTYEPLPKQSPFIASPATSPQKRGFFQSLFDGKSTTTTTTTPIKLDDTGSDTESSPGRKSSYSSDQDFNNELTQSADSDVEVSTTCSQFVRIADTSSDISASDLEEADAFRNSCRVVNHREEQLVTIKVNSAADIRVATSVTGEVTTCVKTATAMEYKGRK